MLIFDLTILKSLRGHLLVMFSYAQRRKRDMFYFDSKTARPIVPLKCAALVFWKAYIDRMLFGYADCKSNTHEPRAQTHILTDK